MSKNNDPSPAQGSRHGPVAPNRLDNVEANTAHLVTHEHVWELRSVEYDDFEVRCYECTGCDDVLYR